jgi:uncharacterized membrane protein HdeD (DUF308 family)
MQIAIKFIRSTSMGSFRAKGDNMTPYETRSRATEHLSAPPTWVRILLGIVLMVAGLFVLGDVAFAKLISAIFIGAVAIAAGAFEIIHACWTKAWGGLVGQLALGALYVGVGIALLNQPASGAVMLTFVLGLLLLLSGILRIFVSFNHWQDAGWIMLLSGAFGVLAGLAILTGFPRTTLWVLGLLLGIDLMSHGAAWLTYGWLPAVRSD